MAKNMLDLHDKYTDRVIKVKKMKALLEDINVMFLRSPIIPAGPGNVREEGSIGFKHCFGIIMA